MTCLGLKGMAKHSSKGNTVYPPITDTPTNPSYNGEIWILHKIKLIQVVNQFNSLVNPLYLDIYSNKSVGLKLMQVHL